MTSIIVSTIKKKGEEEDPNGDMLLQPRVQQELGSVEASASGLSSQASLPGPCACSYLLLTLGSPSPGPLGHP